MVVFFCIKIVVNVGAASSTLPTQFRTEQSCLPRPWQVVLQHIRCRSITRAVGFSVVKEFLHPHFYPHCEIQAVFHRLLHLMKDSEDVLYSCRGIEVLFADNLQAMVTYCLSSVIVVLSPWKVIGNFRWPLSPLDGLKDQWIESCITFRDPWFWTGSEKFYPCFDSIVRT